MSALRQALAAGSFVTTAEVTPPKGPDPAHFLERASLVRPFVTAINVTDNQGANMRISPLAAAALLLREGHEPIMQLTCRDRNRIALQSDLLGAAALGVTNLLALTGDDISFGDHREARQVFDIDSVQLLQVIRALNSGVDASGRRLEGNTAFFCGAAAAPEAEPFELSCFKIEKKIAAGVQFFQTQAVFDLERLARFADFVRPSGVKVIAGVLLIKSAATARFINRAIPGLTVPESLVAELESSADPLATGVEAARSLVAGCREICDGVHVMPLGREDLVPEILA